MPLDWSSSSLETDLVSGAAFGLSGVGSGFGSSGIVYTFLEINIDQTFCMHNFSLSVVRDYAQRRVCSAGY
jgi:hypothetical protein